MQISTLSGYGNHTSLNGQMLQNRSGSKMTALLGQQILSLQKKMTQFKEDNSLSKDQQKLQLEALQKQLDELNDQKGRLEEKKQQKQLEKQLESEVTTSIAAKGSEETAEILEAQTLSQLMNMLKTTKQSPENMDESVYKIYSRLAQKYNPILASLKEVKDETAQ